MTLLGQLLVNGVFVGSIYALLGLSFATIFATNKVWHFAQGAVYTIGAYAILVVAQRWQLGFLAAVAVAIAVATAAGALCAVALYRPLERKGATPLVIVMASLGFMVIVENLLVLAFGPTGHSVDVPQPAPLLLGAIFIGGGQLLAVPIALAVAAGFVAFLFRSETGRLIRALVSNEELLLLNGVDVRRLKLLGFALGSALLPIAAALFLAGGTGITPYMGIPAVLTGAMAMFFGGVDSIEGAAVAGLLMGVIESLAAWLLPTEWQIAVTYAVILVFLMLRPTGLFGRALPQQTL